MMLLPMALAFACMPMLEINTEAGQALRTALGPDARFSVTYWHSMYDAPVTEDFVASPDRQFHLVMVHSHSGAVLEYLGIGDPGPDHAVQRTLPALSFLVATKEAQILTVRDRKWSFREFGAPGARLQFAVVTDCAAPQAPTQK